MGFRFYSLIRKGMRVGMQKVRAAEEKVQAEVVFDRGGASQFHSFTGI